MTCQGIGDVARASPSEAPRGSCSSLRRALSSAGSYLAGHRWPPTIPC